MSTAAEELAPYAIPQEFQDFRETIRKMVVERVAPRAAEIDEKAEYPRDIRELFADARPARAFRSSPSTAAPGPGP